MAAAPLLPGTETDSTYPPPDLLRAFVKGSSLSPEHGGNRRVRGPDCIGASTGWQREGRVVKAWKRGDLLLTEKFLRKLVRPRMIGQRWEISFAGDDPRRVFVVTNE